MLGFDQTITVYNSQYNEAAGFNDYSRTVIVGVSWYSRIKAAANSNGIVYDRLFQVRIPNSAEAEKLYTAPDQFTDPSTQYTLKVGSRIVKGIGPPAPVDGEKWAELITKHDEAFQIIGYRDNRRIGLKHLYVDGK